VVELTEGEPTTVNDPALATAARSLLPEAGFDLAPPMRSCGSDDFGFYGRVAPALMMFVGLEGGPGNGDLPLHHPRRDWIRPAYRPACNQDGVRSRRGRL
jgi:metal-dependent amidase/aminoacylase/carboxypeptidase family protein